MVLSLCGLNHMCHNVLGMQLPIPLLSQLIQNNGEQSSLLLEAKLSPLILYEAEMYEWMN